MLFLSTQGEGLCSTWELSRTFGIFHTELALPTPKQLDNIFGPIEQAIKAAAPSQSAPAAEKLRALKQEAAKGANADDSVIAKLVEGLIELVPSALAALVGAFANPILEGIAGPVTKYVLDKIQGK